MSRTARIALGVAIGVVAGNALGYGAHVLVGVAPPPAPAPAPAIIEPPNDALTRAHRLAGMHALEAGDYALAIREFEAGAAAPHPSPDLPRLLSIARNLAERAKAEEATAAAGQPDEEADEPDTGLVLVTTTPPKLTIAVDGKVRDMSPARLEMETGEHLLTISEGSEVVFRRRYTVRRQRVVPVNLDLTERLAALRPAPAPAEAPPTAPPPTPTPTTSAPIDTGVSLSQAFAPPDVGPATEPEPSEPEPSAPEPATPKPTVTPPPPVPAPPTTIPQSIVRRVVGRASDRFERCYERRRRTRTNLRGAIMLKMQVLPSGEVQEATMDSDLRERRVENCVGREMKRLRFPPHDGPGPRSARSRLVFKPE